MLLNHQHTLAVSPFAVSALGQLLDSHHDAIDTSTHQNAIRVLEEVLKNSSDCTTRQVAAQVNFACAAEQFLVLLQAAGCVSAPTVVIVLMTVAENDSEGDVRATACHSLLRVITLGTISTEETEWLSGRLKALAENDSDRYVTAYAAEAVHRLTVGRTALGGSGGWPVLVRWCSRVRHTYILKQLCL